MGIKDLNAFLKERAPGAIRETLLNTYSGKRVAIDTSIFFYKFLYKNPRFLEGFFQMISRLRSNGITPIYIFDGTPPKEKLETLYQRKEKKTEYKNRIQEIENELNNIDNVEKVDNKDADDKEDSQEVSEEKKKQLTQDLLKLKKKLIHVTKEHIDMLKYLLDMMNIKWLHPNCEADVVCGKLLQNGVVDLVLSDDMDLLVSGSDVLLRDFHISTNKITEYRVDRILQDLSLTYDQWVDFCILCGSDYTSRIHGVGPKNAYKFIKKYINIEALVKDLCGDDKKYKIPDKFNFVNARKLFKTCEQYKDDYNDINVNVEELYDNQLDNIKKYMLQNSHLSEKQINNRFKKIYKLI